MKSDPIKSRLAEAFPHRPVRTDAEILAALERTAAERKVEKARRRWAIAGATAVFVLAAMLLLAVASGVLHQMGKSNSSISPPEIPLRAGEE